MSPAPPNASFSIIAIGNPGSGKSTTLNYLAQKRLFKSGVSIGGGMTYELNKEVVELNEPEDYSKVTVTFCDTPGLNDSGKREAAGKAITDALKAGGKTKVIFFVGQKSGRPLTADVTTMKLVLEACPEIENKYGIIVPEINKKMREKLTDETKFIDPEIKEATVWTDAWTKFLGGLFNGVKKNKCALVNVQGIQKLEKLEDEDDLVADPGELKTLEDNTLEDFVFYVLPFIDLTVGGRKDFKAVDTSSFDEQSAEIAKLIAEAGKQQKMMADLQAQVAASRKTDYFKEILNWGATLLAPIPTLMARGIIAGVEKMVKK